METTEHNVIDFVERYVRRMARDYRKSGDQVMAENVEVMLDEYNAGSIDIFLERGVLFWKPRNGDVAASDASDTSENDACEGDAFESDVNTEND
jgi:hypothetical protein